ncbi:MAG: ABC transporter substrate-binding protein [Nitrospinae bacterium]|nr:ABC transporter substrate-binding protein [Nitrospinota bacterium]
MRVSPILFALLISACSQSVVPQNTLVVGMETDAASLDPRYATDAVSTNLCRLVYAGLLRRDEKMALRPWLAVSVEQKDSATYVINLKRDAMFGDGRPLTSADVRYTMTSILDEKSSSPLKGAFGEVLSIETPDAFTIAVKLREPFAPFLGGLTFGIVPQFSGDLSEKPVGAGPFRVVSRKRGADIRLARNNLYFDKIPALEGVWFKIIPDETVRLLELVKGNLQMVNNPIMPYALPWIKRQKNLMVATADGTSVSYVGFNLRDERLKDSRVRKAVAHAIDRDAIIKYFLKNTAIKSDTLMAAANPFHSSGTTAYEFNPEKAKKLLDDAGYPDRGGDKPRLKLEFKTSKNPERKKLAEIFGEYLKKVGILLEIKSLEWGTFYSDVRAGNFQMYSLTWVGIADPDVLRNIFHSKSLPPNGFNRGGYSNPELDALLDAGKAEQDLSKRTEIYGRAQKILSDDLPFFNLWSQINVAALDRRVKNFAIFPDEGLDSLSDVSISVSEK